MTKRGVKRALFLCVEVHFGGGAGHIMEMQDLIMCQSVPLGRR